MSDVELKGMAELAEVLKGFSARAQRLILRGASRAMAAEARKRARELVPTKTGALQKSIRVSQPRGRERANAERQGLTYSSLKAGGTDEVWYAHLVEFGTEPHSLAPGARLKDNFRQDKGPKHPGTQPVAYMRRALDESQKEAIAAAARYIARRMVRGR